MAKHFPPISYNEYLKVPELVSLQSRRSAQFGRPAHDETLFIIVHQTYELWFKQILTELNSAIEIFRQPLIDESAMGSAVARLQRVVSVQRLLLEQITVLETMTPLDFLEFREFIYPASGFQSAQFREIENKLGLQRTERLDFNAQPYLAYVDPAERERLVESERTPSLFDLLESWLARTPFLESENFEFWAEYRRAVARMFDRDRGVVEGNPLLNAVERERNVAELSAHEKTFDALFDPVVYEQARAEGQWRFSHRAIRACLLIQLYRNQPILHLPHLLLTALQDIDEGFTQWRYRHALMAHRMLGAKIGTGGSSGASYLRAATEKHRIYLDLFSLATYLIPRSELPALPPEARKQLGFYHGA